MHLSSLHVWIYINHSTISTTPHAMSAIRLQVYSDPHFFPLRVLNAQSCSWRMKCRGFPLPQPHFNREQNQDPEEWRRLKTPERREVFLQEFILLPPFLIAARRQITLKIIYTGFQVGSLLQLLHVMDVLQHHAVGHFPPVPTGDRQGSCWHVEGLAAAYGGLQLRERVTCARSSVPGRLLLLSPDHVERETKD